MIMTSNNFQQKSSMIDNTYQVVFQSRYGRNILQDSSSSSSSFNTSQPSFIALICVIIVLTIGIVITIIILCYRYYSHREEKSKRGNKFKRVLSVADNQQSTVPISITPSSVSSYSARSSQHLFHNQQQPQTPSISTSSSTGRLQQSTVDAYLNSFPPTTLDAKQLNNYLFIDLHSTSSETFPDTVAKHFSNDRSTPTSGYYATTGGEDKMKNHRRRYYSQQKRRQSTLAKRSTGSRFIMRERSLPNNLQKLPQLRQPITQQQKHLFGTGDTNNSSTSTSNQDQDLLSTTISIATDDYDDSHGYHVRQSQILQTIEEENPPVVHQVFPSFPYPIHHYEEPYLFEMVSTYRGDDSDIQTYSSIPGNGIAYVNDSIIV